jgi:hypothetical protein
MRVVTEVPDDERRREGGESSSLKIGILVMPTLLILTD